MVNTEWGLDILLQEWYGEHIGYNLNCQPDVWGISRAHP